jgi:dihydrofolate reductase
VRRIRYQVAASLDGYIAGPNGEYDWIVMDPDIDFNALFDQFDTLLMGRHTYEMMQGGPAYTQRVIVISRTMKQADHPNVTVLNDNIADQLTALRAEPGKDIWLFGGGELFRSLLAIDQVDTVEPAIIPVVIGGGIPFLPAPATRKQLALSNHHVYPKSGIMMLTYDVVHTPQKKKRTAKVAKHNA